MTEVIPNEAQDADGGGTQPEEGAKTFTQEEVNALIQKRTARAEDKFSDYADLKAKADKFSEIEEANKSELQKAQEKAKLAEESSQIAIKKANTTLIRADFIDKASRLGVAHPEDAYALADKSGVKINEAGEVVGTEDVVKSIVESGRLVMRDKPTATSLNGGAGGQYRTGENKHAELTDVEKGMASKYGVTPEEYQEYKDKE